MLAILGALHDIAQVVAHHVRAVMLFTLLATVLALALLVSLIATRGRRP